MTKDKYLEFIGRTETQLEELEFADIDIEVKLDKALSGSLILLDLLKTFIENMPVEVLESL